MKTPAGFCSLLIRGTDLSDSDLNYIKSLYNTFGRDEIYNLKKKKKILPFAANTFVHYQLDADFWHVILDEYRNRNKSILCFLNKVYKALEQEGVNKMFVSENFAALLESGNDIALFASGDVDNYADPSEKLKIYSAFEKIGCSRKERFSGKHQIAAEFFPDNKENLPEGFYISVDFYPLARLKLPCFIKADDFVDWNNLIKYANTSVVLPPAEALTYICMLHISLHSFSRAPDIRLYIDLLNTSNLNVNFDKLAEWAKMDRTCTRLSVAANISNSLIKTNYPEVITNLSLRRNRVERKVYDQSINDLIYEPRGIKVFCIEVLCDDLGVLHGVKEILFPDSNWMLDVYGTKGLAAHIKHAFRVI